VRKRLSQLLNNLKFKCETWTNNIFGHKLAVKLGKVVAFQVALETRGRPETLAARVATERPDLVVVQVGVLVQQLTIFEPAPAHLALVATRFLRLRLCNTTRADGNHEGFCTSA